MSFQLLSLKIEFSGGLELLFSNQRSHRVQIPSIVPSDNSTTFTTATPSQLVSASDISKDLSTPETAPHLTGEKTKPTDVTYLMYYLRDHLLKERVELFMEGGTV
jgi:ubiquitin related modifier 1